MNRRPWRTAGEATVRIAAPPDMVYARIADVTAIGDVLRHVSRGTG